MVLDCQLDHMKNFHSFFIVSSKDNTMTIGESSEKPASSNV